MNSGHAARKHTRATSERAGTCGRNEGTRLQACRRPPRSIVVAGRGRCAQLGLQSCGAGGQATGLEPRANLVGDNRPGKAACADTRSCRSAMHSELRLLWGSVQPSTWEQGSRLARREGAWLAHGMACLGRVGGRPQAQWSSPSCWRGARLRCARGGIREPVARGRADDAHRARQAPARRGRDWCWGWRWRWRSRLEGWLAEPQVERCRRLLVQRAKTRLRSVNNPGGGFGGRGQDVGVGVRAHNTGRPMARAARRQRGAALRLLHGHLWGGEAGPRRRAGADVKAQVCQRHNFALVRRAIFWSRIRIRLTSARARLGVAPPPAVRPPGALPGPAGPWCYRVAVRGVVLSGRAPGRLELLLRRSVLARGLISMRRSLRERGLCRNRGRR